MKNKLRLGVLILTLGALAACQEGLSISSLNKSSSTADFSSAFDSSILSNDISSSSNGSSSDTPSYQPIDLSNEEDVFSRETKFELSMNKITEANAEALVNNDVSQVPEEQSSHRKTAITKTKEESHVTKNRSTSNYSVKDLVTEKHSIRKVDTDQKWCYTKSLENTTTTYFEEEPLIRHVVIEKLIYEKDNVLYEVCSEKSYYEGKEKQGTFESYFIKRNEYNLEEYGNPFDIQIQGFVYFYKTTNLGKIDRDIFSNFNTSSMFYTIDNPSLLSRTTNKEYYSSGEKGRFGCVANDSCNYNFSDLRDYPSMEKNAFSTISYHQDYMLNITDYFTYELDSLVTSTSKSATGEVVRDEKIDSRKAITEECDVFYPDLSKFEEREYTPPIYK